ncbi:MAG: hypothetical protein HY862_02520 [Chloroflexi bacterium]|nr:hypothetical protein [Chloroflexota bacterium]
MASVDTQQLHRHSRHLVLLQIGQIGIGVLSQIILLARWSPHPETDLFLVVSGIPWLVSAALLISGLEMALPSAYHHVTEVESFLSLLLALTIIIALVAALFSGSIIFVLAQQNGLPLMTSLVMGALLGFQIVPTALTWLGRGVLVAREQLSAARVTLLMGSFMTLGGYAVIPGHPAIALPVVTIGAALWTAVVTWRFCGGLGLQINRSLLTRYTAELKLLGRAVTGISVAAGLVHLQLLVERTAILLLGTGYVAAFNVAGRGYEALMALVVSGFVMPAYPHWAKNAESRQLLGWSLKWVVGLGAILSLGVVVVAIFTLTVLEGRWTAGRQTMQAVLVLLPRFWLLTSLQPLILKHFAQGETWPPVIGSLLGIGIIGGGAVILLPQAGLVGLALLAIGSVAPGWIILGWREGRGR